MLRSTVIQCFRTTTIPVRRNITTTALKMGEGDAGAPKAGGSAQADAFSKREEASENFYFRQKENEKLQVLKEKIKSHQEHLEELDKNVTDQINASKGQGEQK